MGAKSAWETIKLEGAEILEQIKKVVEEGNARRLIIKHKGQSVAEFPLTVGVVGALLAPILAAVGTLIALLSDCSIEIERRVPRGEPKASRANGPRRSRGDRK